jgi:hypothetical protein
MSPTVLVFDDTLQDADSIRQDALQSDFVDETYQGAVYPGILPSGGMAGEMEYRIGEALGSAIDMRLSFFRLTLAGQHHPTFIHCDRSVGTEWAAVYYLTPPEHCQGGTAFWQHRSTGLERLPVDSDAGTLALLGRDGQDQSAWNLVGLVGMKWNRLVLYPGDLFHSRFPKNFPAEEKAKGRLTWVGFFNEI